MSHPVESLTCQHLLQHLDTDWKTYPAHYQALDPARQADFLDKQGFATFHDLLAHIIAWWEEAIKIVQSILDVEELPQREYDLNAFNLAAVRHYQKWSDADLLIHYENLRQGLIGLVVEQPGNALSNKRICGWLQACLLDHYHEHAIQE